MAFFGNDAINRVNLHSAVQARAYGAGAIFFLVFLLRAGISVPAALTTQAAILAVRLALCPAILPNAKRWGLKPTVILGTLLLALQYPLLAEVHGVGARLALVCLAAAIGEILYYPAYNAYFAALGDREHRGHQISAREAMVAVVSIVAPLIGAWALVTLGPRPMFAAVGVIQALAALPLLGAANVAVKRRAPGAFRAGRLGAILYASDAWFDTWFIFAWNVALFVSLGESVSAYGGAMALAALVGAASGLWLGRHVDAGAWPARGGHRLLGDGGGRSGAGGEPRLAVDGGHRQRARRLRRALMLPVLGTATYNLAKASPCPLRFGIAAEAGWDLGAIAGCLAAAGLALAGVPLAAGTLLALPGLAVAVRVLRRYFAETAEEVALRG